MEVLKPDTRGYCKVKKGAAYGGVSERTFRDWLKQGLPYHKLPTGTVLISYADIDQYLSQFRKDGTKVSEIADQIMKDY
jgi:excisionase family DNA binding protein